MKSAGMVRLLLLSHALKSTPYAYAAMVRIAKDNKAVNHQDVGEWLKHVQVLLSRLKRYGDRASIERLQVQRVKLKELVKALGSKGSQNPSGGMCNRYPSLLFSQLNGTHI